VKLVYTLFILLIFLSSSLAVGSRDLDFFIFDYLRENETFTKVPFNLSDGEYYIISVEEPTFLIHVLPKGDIEMVSEKESIKKSLIGYYALQGITMEELKLNKTYSEELLSLVDSFNKSRKGEYECRRLTGTDRFPCVDLETCWRACYTPICQQLKIGAGRPFLELIWAFSNSSIYIDSNYTAFKEKISSISEWESKQQVDDLIFFVDSMKNDSVKIGDNDLLNPLAIGFCPAQDSDISYLVQARIKLLKTKGRIAPLVTLDETAEKILNNTSSRMKGLPKKQRCSSMVSRNTLEFSSVKNEFSTFSSKKMSDKLAELEKLAGVEGCEKMTESQLYSAQKNFSNLSQNVEEYGWKLKEVSAKKNETSYALSKIQGDILLFYQVAGFNSKLNELNSKIDSAELEQLPAIESQLDELKTQIENSGETKYSIFILCMALAVIIMIGIIYTKRKNLSIGGWNKR
jgi:hypothetical protein